MPPSTAWREQDQKRYSAAAQRRKIIALQQAAEQRDLEETRGLQSRLKEEFLERQSRS